MSQIYIWQFTGISEQSACERFAGLLEGLISFYNEHLTNKCTLRYVQVGDILVGQISTDLGIKDWKSWNDLNLCGVAWSGICEDFLGTPEDLSSFYNLIRDVIEIPANLNGLTGSFSVCAWNLDKGKVAVATSATQHQTLWQTKGPSGWALGSRAKIVLELAGLNHEMDEEGIGIFLGYKYLLGKGALFKNVKRLPGRQHILLKQNSLPQETTYLSLSDYLGQPIVRDFNEAVELCSEHLKNRVARQLRFSLNPLISLTGGRDSRCISAALSCEGFVGNSITYDSTSSIDVKISAKVAKTLGFQHITIKVDPLELLVASRKRAKLWIKLSEGIETIQHGLYYKSFFSTESKFPGLITQTFNGHHAGLQKPSIVSYTPAKVNKNVGPHLKFNGAIKQQFEGMKKEVIASLDALCEPRSRWSELYLWQVDALQWGQDNMLVKDLFNWWWTPLFDKLLIQIGWHLPEEYQASMRLIESMTVRLAPRLKGLAYDDPIFLPLGINYIRKGMRFGQRKIQSYLDYLQDRTFAHKSNRKHLWKAVLFETPDTTWKEWIDEGFVLKIIEEKGDEQILWNTVTVQLFKEAFFPN